MKDRTGEKHGTVTITGPASVKGGRHWCWTCAVCGGTGIKRYERIIGERACMRCAFAQAPAPGVTYGKYRIIEELEAERRYRPDRKNGRLIRRFRAVCLRCGAEKIFSDRIHNTLTGCGTCSAKRELWGLLLTLDEIAEVVGMKRSLLDHRLMHMPLEQAVTKPIQKQVRGPRVLGPTKHCAGCDRELSLASFGRDKGNKTGLASRCKLCRKVRR